MHISTDKRLFGFAQSGFKKTFWLLLVFCIVSGTAHGLEHKDKDSDKTSEDKALNSPKLTPSDLLEGPSKSSKSPMSVLVLPTLIAADTGADSNTFDVLMAANFKALGFRVFNEDYVIDKYHPIDVSIDAAKEAYLDMRLEESLAIAKQVRSEHLDHYGDLLSGDDLLDANLFIVQVMLNLNLKSEAEELAVKVLFRHPGLKLDPEIHSPAMQSLWLTAEKKRKILQPKLPITDKLVLIGREVEVDWVAAAIRKADSDGNALFEVLMVPTNNQDKPSRHTVVLGTRTEWSNDIRSAIEQRFPSPQADSKITFSQTPTTPEGRLSAQTDKKKWYKTWWFWTGVGVFVVGGVALAVGVYNRNQNDTPPSVVIKEPLE